MKSSSSLPGGGLLSALILLALLLAATAAPAQDALSLGHASGPPGTVVALPLTLDGGAEALQLDLLFDPAHLVFEGVVAGPGLAGRVLDWSEVAPGRVRLVAYWLTCTSQRSSGQGLASLQLRISSQATPGLEWVELADVVLADSEAGLIAPVTLADGSVEILGEPGDGDLPPSLIEIPTLGQIGLVLLSLLMALAACLALRRFGAAMVVALLLGSAALVTASLAASGHALESRSGAFDIEAIESIADAILGRAAETPEMDCNQDGEVDARDLVCALNDFCDTEVGDNQPPVMEPIADQMVEAGQTLSVQVEASDPDPGDVLSFDLPQGPTGMAIDPSSGLITWGTTADDLGQHPVTARVTDSGGLTDSQSFQVTVAEVVENQPPSLSAIADRSLLAGQVLSVQPEATDPDLPDDVLTFSLSSRPSGMSLNAATGSILWVPTEGQVGDHELTLIVTDAGGLSDATAFTVTVSTVGSPPTLQPIPNQELVLGDSLALTAQASDPDLPNDVLTFSLPLAPAGMSIHAASGSIAWTPESGQVGLHDVTVQVTDQVGLLDVSTFTVTVRDVNRAPVARDDEYITPKSETTTIDAPGVLENDFDPDGDPITAELVSEPNRGVLDFRTDGSFDYTPGPVLSQFEAELVTDFRTLTIDGNSATWRVNRGTVVAADLTGNGRSELISIGQRGSGGNSQFLTAVAFNEDDELELLWFWNGWFTAIDPAVDPDRDFAMRSSRDPVIGDLDGDGIPEVVVAGYCRGEVLVFSNLGEPLVSTQAGRVPQPGEGESTPDCRFLGGAAQRARLSLVDLTGNGRPEIITTVGSLLRVFESTVENGALSDLELLWEAQAPNFSPGGPEYDYAVADVNLDGRPNIWFGGALFDADGNVLWSKATNPLSNDWMGAYAVANLNDDPFAELIYWGTGDELVVLDHQGQCLWQARRSNPNPTLDCPTPITIPDFSPGFIRGGLMVGDIAGDGVTRIVIGGRSNTGGVQNNGVAAFNPDGSLFWFVPTVLSSGTSVRPNQINGFDFTGNGVMELVVTGVNGTVVLDGRDGSTLFEIPADDDNPGLETGAGQDMLYSIIVDLDGDGAAELVVSSQGGAGLSGDRPTGLFVYRDPQNRWMPTRGIWNQWAYSITNVNPDASIPSPAERNWLTAGLNNYRVNQPMPGEPGAFDRFTYRAFDGELHSNEATVFLDIRRPNRPPVILSSPPIIVGAGFDYRYQVHAFDSDPGDIVTVALELGPPGMFLDSDDIVRWAPTMADLGTHEVLVSARDTENAFALQEYLLEVVEAQPVPNVVGQPLADAQAAITAASFVVGTVTDTDHPTVPAGSVAGQSPPGGAHEAPGTAVQLAVSTGPGPGDIDADGDGFTPNQGDCDDTNPDIFPGAPDPFGDGIDWNCNGIDGDRPVVAIVIEPEPLDLLQGEQVQLIAHGIFDDGSAQLITGAVNWSVAGTAATISAGGLLTATSGGSATVTASRDGITGTLPVTVTEKDNDDDAAPTAEISSPGDGAVVLGPVDILGTAADPNLVRFELAISPADQETFIVIGGGTAPVIGGVLGQLDPTLTLNALYTLRLTVLDAGGNQSIDQIVVQVDGQQKVGHFTLSFTDLQIPVSGIPITVTRTYDSRDKRPGDFGVGWRLGVETIELTCSNPLGEGWFVAKSGISYVLLPTRTHRCTVDIPGQRTEVFDFVPSATVSPVVPFSFLSGSFQATPGTLGKLEARDGAFLAIVEPQPGEVTLLNDGDLSLFAPTRFRYTTGGGDKIDFGTSGIERVEDRNGNSLTFGPGGISHSSGLAITFERDAQGRISGLLDPKGHLQTYSYSAAGNLVAHTDAVGNTTRFFYDHRHGMIRVDDPLERPLVRNEYDQEGRLISATSPSGRTVTYQYDLAGQVVTTVDVDGATTIIEYDAEGNVTSTTDALGGVTSNSYDAQGNAVSTTLPSGETITRTFDSRNNLSTFTSPSGQAVTLSYNTRDQIIELTDDDGLIDRFEYDTRGNLISRISPSGDRARVTYNANGELATIIDRDGATTNLEYDARGLMTARTDAWGNRTTYEYDANGNLVSETDGLGATTTSLFDSRGLLVSRTDRLGNTTTFGYDPRGLLTRYTDPLGNVFRRELDAEGRVTSIIDPLGQTTTFDYGPEGTLTKVTDPEGRETSFSYDLLRRRVATIAPDGSTSQIEYDSLGRITAEIDARGNRSELTYDATRMISRTDPLGNETTFSYDSRDRLIEQTDALGQTQLFDYDAMGRLSRVVLPDGSEQSYGYDAMGRQTSIIDELGHSTLFEYDLVGNLTTVIDALGNVTRYGYDAAGRLVLHTDAVESTTRMDYDAEGRLTRFTLPTGWEETQEFDPAGRVVAVTNAVGQTVSFERDAKGRIVVKRLPDGSQVAFAYTPTDQLASLHDHRGTTIYSYDSRNRPIVIAKPEGSLEYTWDLDSNLTSLTTHVGGSSRTVSYGWNQINRLTSLIEDGMVTTHSYDALGRPTQTTRPNGALSDYQWDARNRIAELTHWSPITGTLGGFIYTHDPVGNITRVDENDGHVVAYSYDQLRRLVRETQHGPDGVLVDLEYVYDGAGNRLEMFDHVSSSATQYTYDAAHRLLSAGDSSFLWDAAGRLVSRNEPGGATHYTWSAEDLLMEVTGPVGTFTYAYDAFGNRISERGPSGDFNLLIDDNNPSGWPQTLEEVSALTGARSVSYTYGRQLHSQRRSGLTSFYHLDAQGNVRLLTDASAAIANSYRYSAFGTLASASVAVPNDMLFKGENRRVDLGLDYMRARWYDPVMSRFLTRDAYGRVLGDQRIPAAAPPGPSSLEDRWFEPIPMRAVSRSPVALLADQPMALHPYAFAWNNPVAFSDPSGQLTLTEKVFAIAVGGAIGGSVSAGALVLHDGGFATLFSSQGLETVIKGAILGAVGGLVAAGGGSAVALSAAFYTASVSFVMDILWMHFSGQDVWMSDVLHFILNSTAVAIGAALGAGGVADDVGVYLAPFLLSVMDAIFEYNFGIRSDFERLEEDMRRGLKKWDRMVWCAHPRMPPKQWKFFKEPCG